MDLDSTAIATSIFALLVFSIIVFKLVRMLTSPRAARHASRPRAREESLESVAEVGEDLVEEEKMSWAKEEDELGEEEQGLQEESAEEEIEKPAPEKKTEKRVQVQPPKKLSNVSPQDYPECFGTPDAYENCERSCGVVEECESAISVLRKFTD